MLEISRAVTAAEIAKLYDVALYLEYETTISYPPASAGTSSRDASISSCTRPTRSAEPQDASSSSSTFPTAPAAAEGLATTPERTRRPPPSPGGGGPPGEADLGFRARDRGGIARFL